MIHSTVVLLVVAASGFRASVLGRREALIHLRTSSVWKFM